MPWRWELEGEGEPHELLKEGEEHNTGYFLVLTCPCRTFALADFGDGDSVEVAKNKTKKQVDKVIVHGTSRIGKILKLLSFGDGHVIMASQ
jgi:hypothetical protein